MTLFVTLVIPVRFAAQVTGSGTTNFIPRWTGSTTLGNSKLFQTSGKVGIRTTNPAATLDVIGPTGSSGIGHDGFQGNRRQWRHQRRWRGDAAATRAEIRSLVEDFLRREDGHT
jgi:hypothetical protein